MSIKVTLWLHAGCARKITKRFDTQRKALAHVRMICHRTGLSDLYQGISSMTSASTCRALSVTDDTRQVTIEYRKEYTA